MGENSVNWKGQILSKGKNESMPSGPQELEGKEGSTKGQKIKNLWAISNYQENFIGPESHAQWLTTTILLQLVTG